MQEHRAEWEKLCELAAVEQDHEKLMELVRQINDMLEAKGRRLKDRADSIRDKSDS